MSVPAPASEAGTPALGENGLGPERLPSQIFAENLKERVRFQLVPDGLYTRLPSHWGGRRRAISSAMSFRPSSRALGVEGGRSLNPGRPAAEVVKSPSPAFPLSKAQLLSARGVVSRLSQAGRFRNMSNGQRVISSILGDDMRSANADKLRKHVSVLATFGGQAFRSGDIGELLQEAALLVSEAMDVDLVKVLQLLPDGQELLVRAGVNWKPGVVGHAKLPAHEGSPGGHALRRDEAVISDDIAKERRFEIPKLLIEHGVRSMVNVVIRGEHGPFGVLEVDAQRPRQFDQDDIDFMQNYANLLAAAVDRVNTHQELAENAQKLEVSAHELQHRMNNMLAMIRAIAQSARTKYTNIDEFVEAFDNRLGAISRIHNLLGHSQTTDISIREILKQELAAYGADEDGKVVEGGPHTAVSPKQAEALEMAFHELVTNAVKHGALSAKGGRIKVSWDTHPQGPGKQVHICWQESGARIEQSPTKRGFGSEILEKAIPHMLNGTIERKFHPDGIECLIEFATET